MPSVCVDASLVLALLLPEENSEKVRNLWERWRSDAIHAVAPPMLLAEVSSVLRGAVHFRRIDPDEGDQAFQAFGHMPIRIREYADLLERAWGIAKRFNQPQVYDSLYLAVAEREGCDFWTGDKRLAKATQVPWIRWIGDVELSSL